MTTKTEKEQAFLYDLYITPDWSERFAGLIDEHMTVPKRGRVLYVASGTGDHTLAIASRAGSEVEVTGIDEKAERTALARAKQTVATTDAGTEFRTAQLEALPFDDEAFDLVIGNLSLIPAYRTPEIIAEMWRVARPGGEVAFATVTASSFGEFLSLYWEALATTGEGEHAALVERLISELPTVSDVESLATREGLDEVQSWTQAEEFQFASGEEFLNAPLVSSFLLPEWLATIPDGRTQDEVRASVQRLIDEEEHDAETPWTFSIKATFILGRRGE